MPNESYESLSKRGEPNEWLELLLLLSKRGVLILNSLTHDRNVGGLIKGNEKCIAVLKRLATSTNDTIGNY